MKFYLFFPKFPDPGAIVKLDENNLPLSYTAILNSLDKNGLSALFTKNNIRIACKSDLTISTILQLSTEDFAIYFDIKLFSGRAYISELRLIYPWIEQIQTLLKEATCSDVFNMLLATPRNYENDKNYYYLIIM